MANLSTLIGVKISYKGNYDASGNIVPPGAVDGDQYRVSVAGTISGQALKVGDLFIVSGGAAVAVAGDATINQVDTNTADIGTVTGDLSTHEGLVNEHIDWELASQGTIDITNLPGSIQNGLTYQGTWNASTNTPTLADGTGTQGHYYKVDVGGTIDLGSGSQTFAPGDRVVHNGTIWDKWDATDQVTSVHGRLGDVVAVASDYDAVQIDYSPDVNIEATETEVKGALDTLLGGKYIGKSAGFTALTGGKYNANTAGGAFNMLLATGFTGNSVVVRDDGDNWATNNLTINTSSSQLVNGTAAPFILDVDGALVEFAWTGGSIGWKINVLN